MKTYSLCILMLCSIWFYTPLINGQENPIKIGQQSASAEVPNQSKALYQEINESLDQAAQLFALKSGKPLPIVAPGLFLAGSGLASTQSAKNWENIISTLDAFKEMNADAVSIMIAAPDLTIGDSSVLIGFYKRLAEEIHSRKMKLYIEHFDNPPFSPHAHKISQNTDVAKKEFLQMREHELSMIYRLIKPDFLSLITEPETMMRWSKLTFSVDELAEWVGEVSARLKALGVSPKTLLGAGAGTWESGNFALKCAKHTSLDYIDIHVYALNSSVNESLLRLDSMITDIRKINPEMKVTIGETWLYKKGIKEPVTPAMYKETFYRDNFSFWSSLDQKYMELVLGIAQKDNISVVAPYFSQYFFTYYTFGEKESEQLPPWPWSVLISWTKAMETLRKHTLSSTGNAMKFMLQIHK